MLAVLVDYQLGFVDFLFALLIGNGGDVTIGIASSNDGLAGERFEIVFGLATIFAFLLLRNLGFSLY